MHSEIYLLNENAREGEQTEMFDFRSFSENPICGKITTIFD